VAPGSALSLACTGTPSRECNHPARERDSDNPKAILHPSLLRKAFWSVVIGAAIAQAIAALGVTHGEKIGL